MSKTSLHIVSILQKLEKSSEIYVHYLENNKSYMYAKKLYDNNTDVFCSIKTCLPIASGETADSLRCILSHLTNWMSLWEEHDKKSSYQDSDTFVFQNADHFPKDSEKKLMRLYNFNGVNKS
ncbi:MAG: hypothetical protein CMP10_04850 [Zetaproteobacteria bacterium]|nr:hypothetical protein [Pseudobdellovibrionaceae bacterium]